MLIRLVSHTRNNKWAVDKMIFVDGIPEDLLYMRRGDKLFLKEPWTFDVTENIPDYIRQGIDPFEVNIFTSPTEKGLPAREDTYTVYGLVLDYQNPRGEDIWKRIERMIDQDTPRGENLPEPVLVSDQIDNDHRMLGFSIQFEDIPQVVLSVHPLKAKPVVKKTVETPLAEPPQKEVIVPAACSECGKQFPKGIQGLRMHQMKTKHKQTVPVTAGV